jgi:hypothetical protein
VFNFVCPDSAGIFSFPLIKYVMTKILGENTLFLDGDNQKVSVHFLLLAKQRIYS